MLKYDLILTAEYILTDYNQAEGRWNIHHDAAVAIADGKVAAIGEQWELLRANPDAQVKRLGRVAIMPGLINAHTHLPMTLLRGLADDLPLMEWLQDHIWPVENRLSSDMLRCGTMLACAEMLRTGTTAFLDMYLQEDLICETVQALGMRGVLGEGLALGPTIGCKEPGGAIALARKYAEKWRGSDRVRYCISPHAVYSTSPEFLEQAAALAAETDLPLHIHLAETTTETENCLKEHGVRPVELCRKAGILGPKTTIAHGVDLIDEELELLRELDVKVAHNPKSNLKLASGVARVPDMLKRGIKVGLGTDGAASNNALNMFSEMSFCALLHKGVSLDPTLVSAGETLHMATAGSAACLHQPNLGRLQPGAPADLVALDLSQPNLVPVHDPVSSLVYAASGHEVCLSMVDGKVLYEDGKFTSFDYAAVQEEALEIRNWAKGLK